MSVVISGSFVISPVASGGGVINGDNPVFGYQNLAIDAPLNTTTENPSFPASNLINPATYLRWEGTSIIADEYITMELDSVDDVDYVGIARHNFFSSQIPVSLEIFNGLTWDEVITPFIPPNNGPILMRFEPQSVTDIRVRLQPGLVVPTASVVYTGLLLVSQRRIYVGHAPIPYAKKTKIITGRSESGNFLGRIVVNAFTQTTVDLENIMPDWMRLYFAPFLEAAREIPFFFAWRPLTYPNEVGYAWIMNDPLPTNQRSNGMMKVTVELGSIV